MQRLLSLLFLCLFLSWTKATTQLSQSFQNGWRIGIKNALESSFVNAQNVRSFLHFKSNLERKLQELKISNSVKDDIVKDVMGNPCHLQYGLVDSESVEQLESTLLNLQTRWNELERPYNSPPFFHTWFMRHCHDVIAKFILPEICTKAGLGYPSVP